MKVPFVIYADFESIIEKINDCNETNTKKLQEHIVCGYSYEVVRCDGQSQTSGVYRGKDATEHFLNAIQDELLKINEIFKNPKCMTMTETDIKKI